jgi:hypothetical protein
MFQKRYPETKKKVFNSDLAFFKPFLQFLFAMLLLLMKREAIFLRMKLLLFPRVICTGEPFIIKPVLCKCANC